MEIPLEAQVKCADEVCGRSVYVLINPVFEQVTHVVVREDAFPNNEYNVPVEMVTETAAGSIQLSCSKAELEKMGPFIKTTFIEKTLPVNYLAFTSGLGFGMRPYFYWPYSSLTEKVKVPDGQRQIPPGELAVRRDTRVEATDGYVGKVDEFVVNPVNGYITHLVMREGHLWGKKDVVIPLSALGETRNDTVFLKLDKNEIELLPSFPLQRNWS